MVRPSPRVYRSVHGSEDQLEVALNAEGYSFKITPVSVDVAGNAAGRQQGNGAGDSFSLAQRIAGVFYGEPPNAKQGSPCNPFRRKD
jgi:hypothetical protein